MDETTSSDQPGATIDRRKTDRLQVMLAANITHGPQINCSRLADISELGARLVGPSLSAGARINFRRGDVEVPARVVWTENSISGITFDQRVATNQFLRKIRRCEPRSVPNAGRPGLAPARLTQGQQAILSRWAVTGSPRVGE